MMKNENIRYIIERNSSFRIYESITTTIVDQSQDWFLCPSFHYQEVQKKKGEKYRIETEKRETFFVIHFLHPFSISLSLANPPDSLLPTAPLG